MMAFIFYKVCSLYVRACKIIYIPCLWPCKYWGHSGHTHTYIHTYISMYMVYFHVYVYVYACFHVRWCPLCLFVCARSFICGILSCRCLPIFVATQWTHTNTLFHYIHGSSRFFACYLIYGVATISRLSKE